MNKTYRSVWNKCTGTYVAAPETAKAATGGARGVGSVVIAATSIFAAGGLLAQTASASEVCIKDASGYTTYKSYGTFAGSTSGAKGCEWAVTKAWFPDATTADFATIGSSSGYGTSGMALSNGAVDIAVGALGDPVSTLRIYRDAASNLVRVTGVAPAALTSASTDAVNGSQLYRTASTTAQTFGGGASVDPTTGAISSPTYNVNGGSYHDVASALDSIGNGGGIKYFHANSTLADSSASGANSTAAGPAAAASGVNTIAMGAAAGAVGDYSAAIGNAALTQGLGDTALGASSTANGGGTFATAVGSWSNAAAPGATAMGGYASATAANATAIGYNAKATNANSVALGDNAQTGATNPTAGTTIRGNNYAFAGAAPVGVVSVGSAGAERQITNVAAGGLSASSTDAVNGSQLYATNQAVEAIAGVTDNVVTYDAGSNNAVVTLKGARGTRLMNLADGEVSASSTDAVTGAQLYNIDGTVTSIDNRVTKINNTLTTAGWGAQAPSSNPTAYTMGGFIMDVNGNVSNPAVLYVPGTPGSANPQVVLDPGQGSSLYHQDFDQTKPFMPKGTIISNVADGVQPTDAVNVGQARVLIADALNPGGGGGGGGGGGSGFRALSALSASQGSGAVTTGLNIGYASLTYYIQAMGLGPSNNPGGFPADIAAALGAGSIAIGSSTRVDSSASGGTAVGVQSHVMASDAVALGSGSVANQTNTVSVGNDGTTSFVGKSPDGQSYTYQFPANTRRLVNMAAGQGDNDAVNVSQLKGLTAAVGGGATVNADGSIAAPTFLVAGGTFNDVGNALTAMNGQTQTLSGDAVRRLARQRTPHHQRGERCQRNRCRQHGAVPDRPERAPGQRELGGA
jgi:trimeric autotransporter adhesin